GLGHNRAALVLFCESLAIDALEPGHSTAKPQRRGIRRAFRAIVLESVALVFEFGGLLRGRDEGHALAEPAERQIARPGAREIVKASVAVLAVVSISALILVAPIDYQALGNYGYLGVFLVTLITTGAFVLPIPYLAIIFKAATFLNPALVALVAGVAAA